MSAIIRIALRYLGMFLATKGLIGAQDLWGDPELVALVEMAAGALLALGAEVWYAFAKKMGWRT